MYKAVPTILSSTLYFKPGTTLESSYSFFEDDEEYDLDSFFEKKEEKIVKELLGMDAQRSLIFDALGFNENTPLFIDDLDNTIPNSRIPGDFDLIICNENSINKISALEIKQVKVVRNEIKKIKNVKERGIQQIQGLLKLGFHKVYLGIIVEQYGREDKESQSVIFRQANNEVFKTIINEINYLVPENCGIFFISVVQLTGKHYIGNSSIGAWIHKPATVQEQSPEITSFFKNVMKQKYANPI